MMPPCPREFSRELLGNRLVAPKVKAQRSLRHKQAQREQRLMFSGPNRRRTHLR